MAFIKKRIESFRTHAKKTVPINSMSNVTVPINSMSNGTVPINSMSNGTVPINSMSNETASRNSMSNGTVPINSMSNGTVPRNSMSNGTIPRNSMSNGTGNNDVVINCRSVPMVTEIGSQNVNYGNNSKSRGQTETTTVEVDSHTTGVLLIGKTGAGKANVHTVDCMKHPGHKEFFPIGELEPHHLPAPFQDQNLVDFLKLKGMETVHISVSYTSKNRPEEMGFSEFKGTTNKRMGSGTVFIANMDKCEDCDCSEIQGTHKISGSFKVMTAAHVVFDNKEAQNAVFTFFYDNENYSSTMVKARGVRVSNIDVEKNRSVIECRTHNLDLYQQLLRAQQERENIKQEFLVSQVKHESMVVLISHPHGCSKCVSIGKLLDIEEEGEIKRTKEGVELIGCILTYDTPTCPGTGGGSINVIGNGEVCSAFAPHCASKGDGTNISGLGWTKYVKTMQLRSSY